jgi:hypothetical protein
MESADIIGIIGLALSAATLLAMILGVRLGKRHLPEAKRFSGRKLWRGISN